MSVLEQAKAVQAKRKKRYGDQDKKRNSKIRRKPTEKNLEVWSRNPGRSDMIGVDGEGTPTLKRDQEKQVPAKRKKAAPKRKKAEAKPKAAPKAQTKAKPKKTDSAQDIGDRILARRVEASDKEERETRAGYTVLPVLNKPGFLAVEFSGDERNFLGSIEDTFKSSAKVKSTPETRKTRFRIDLYYKGRKVYSQPKGEGYPGIGFAILGRGPQKGLLGEKAEYLMEAGKKERAKKKADNPKSIVDNLSPADRKKVSMKIDELARIADEARAKGEAAPNYNLCEITIPGTNIYCEANKGIERAKMPQFKGTPVPGSPASKLPKDSKGEVDTEPIFRKQLKEEGIAITPKEIYSDNLKATQSELVGAKVAGMTKALEKDPNHPGITAPIFVSNDNYVIDGHHRWAAVTSYAIKNGLPKKMKVEVIDLPIEEAIKKSNEFADMIGIAQKAAKTEGESKPEATKRRKKEGGVSARKRRKEERRAQTAPSASPEPRIGLGNPEMPFDIPAEGMEAAREALEEIQIIKENFENKFVKVGEARAGVYLAYQRFWSAVGEAKKNAINLAAHIAFVGQMPKSIRPKYNGWGTYKVALGLSTLEEPFILSDQWSNREQALLYIKKVIQGTRIPSAGKMRDKFLKDQLTVEQVLEVLSPITPRYIGNDDLRPSMNGVNINMNGAVAMTNGSILFFGRFHDLNFDVPVIPSRYIGNQQIPDLAQKTIVTLEQQKRNQTYFWRDSSNSITIIPPEQKSRQNYPYEILEEKFPNYFSLIPEDTLERRLNRTNTFEAAYMERVYKTFLMMKEHGLFHDLKETDIVHVYFGNTARHNNVASYEARFMETMLFTSRQFNTTTRIMFDENPWKNKVVADYDLKPSWDQRALTLMMPFITNIEDEKFPFFRRPQGEQFADGGVIDEVELVDNTPFNTRQINSLPMAKLVITDDFGGPDALRGKFVVMTTKQNSELISVRTYDEDGLNQAKRDIITDMARGYIVLNFTKYEGNEPKDKFVGMKWKEELGNFSGASQINQLDYQIFSDKKEFATKLYQKGGKVEKRRKERSYLKQLEQYDDWVIEDPMSEVVDVGDYKPEGGTSADTIEKAARIIHDFYDPDMKRTFEQVIVLYCDKNKNATHIQFLSQGNQTSTVMDPALIMNVAIQTDSPYFWVAHNHPSGNPKPSQADKQVTKAFYMLGKILGIKMLGHIIIPGTPDFQWSKVEFMQRGGYVHGPSHAEGGVTMPVGSSGHMVELEGGEGVVNKRSMASQKTITLNGKRMKPCQAVSEINQMDGNGVPITC